MKYEVGDRVVVVSNVDTATSGIGAHPYESPVAVTVLQGWGEEDEYGEHYRVSVAGCDDFFVSEGDLVSKALWGLMHEEVTWADDDKEEQPVSHDDSPEMDECIEITEYLSFSLGSVVQHVWQARLDDGIEDLKKARWYLDREIGRRAGTVQT